MADQQQETLNLLENFLNQPAWAYVHDHEALLMGVYEPDGEENNEDNTEEESSEESESIKCPANGSTGQAPVVQIQ